MHYRRMIRKIIRKKNVFFFIFILAILVLGITLVLRFANYNSILAGEEPYYHMRIAKEIVEKKNIGYDYLSYAGREYVFEPYDYFLAFAYKLFGFNVFIFLPSVLGVASAALFYFVIKKIGLNLVTRLLVMVTFILSPIFVCVFTTINKHSLVIFLMLVGSFFFFKRKLLNIFSVIIFALVPFFNAVAGLIILLLLLCYVLYIKEKKKEKKKYFYITLILILLVNVLYNLFFYLKYGFPERIAFVSANYLQTLISDLGPFAGLAFFNLILALIGIIVTWKYKEKLWLVYITIAMLLVGLSYFDYLTIYFKFIITVFAGIGFYEIVTMKWKIRFIRNLSILILILGLIFSTTSYITRIVGSLPDKNTKESLQWLNAYSEPEGVVLSHYSRGFWIEYFADRPVVMDSMFRYAPKPNERYSDVNNMFYGSNLRNTTELLDKYNVDYIYIDKKMKHGLVWEKEKQGLLFLFRNNETFKNVYEKNGIEIWQYLRD